MEKVSENRFSGKTYFYTIATQGLSTFFIEFLIVFMGFTCFFFFLLKNQLETFRDIIRAAQNTIAMSIGKFNFGDIKDADLLAAWIFFGFSITVNMILINMMIAIINIAFDDIKSKKGQYDSKFALVSYIKRAVRHKLGTELHRDQLYKNRSSGKTYSQ